MNFYGTINLYLEEQGVLFKKIILFVLFLSCGYQSYANQITNEGAEQIQKENKQQKIFCHYNFFDWYGSSKYDQQSDEIIIENCKWGMGYKCDKYKIPKLAEFDGIKIYYSEKYPENIFINDNENWKWKNAGCDFAEPIDDVKDE